MAKIIRSLILILFLGAFGLTAASSQGQSVQIQNVDLAVPVILQDTPEWCWLAAAQMAIAYRNNGMSYRQCQMMEMGYGWPPGTCCNQPGACMRTTHGMTEVQAVIARFGFTGSVITGPLDLYTLDRLLLSDRPVIAEIVTSQISTHAVVIRGMFLRNEPGVDIYGRMTMIPVPYVKYNDPESLTPKAAPYSRFWSVWVDSLVVDPFRVTPPPPVAAHNASDDAKNADADGSDDGSGDGSSDDQDSAFCSALKRVVRDAPAFRHVRGAQKHAGDDHASYFSRVSIPGVNDCYIFVQDGNSPNFLCHQGADDTPCDDAISSAKSIGARIRECLKQPDAKARESESSPYTLTVHDGMHNADVNIHVRRQNDGLCAKGLFSVSHHSD